MRSEYLVQATTDAELLLGVWSRRGEGDGVLRWTGSDWADVDDDWEALRRPATGKHVIWTRTQALEALPGLPEPGDELIGFVYLPERLEVRIRPRIFTPPADDESGFHHDDFEDWAREQGDSDLAWKEARALARPRTCGGMAPWDDAPGGVDTAHATAPIDEPSAPAPGTAAARRLARQQKAWAEAIARQAHAGQTDKLGEPYIAHPTRVAARFDPIAQSTEHVAALLHDVIEDSAWTPALLRDAGIRRETIAAVLLLTRDAGTTPDEYYARIRQHPIARAVKLADIDDNTAPDRVARLDPATRERLAAKYTAARAALGIGGDGGSVSADGGSAAVEPAPPARLPRRIAERGGTDRAVGVIVGQACGDALGAGYEFGPPLDDAAEVRMGSGPNSMGWAVGEWTDDTAMAIPLLQAAASGRRFDDARTLDEIVGQWRTWARTARDVGIQIRAVLADTPHPTEAAARSAAEELHRRRGRSGGNGSLMRTGPVALAFLSGAAGEDAALAVAARRVSELTHWEHDAGDACVLWTAAIRHAVLTGEADVRVGLDQLPAGRRARWLDLIAEAETRQPRDFEQNGWVVQALQAAWSAIHHGSDAVDALERAVRGGRDTDTVAAIAGQLIGAVHGASAFPAEWRRRLNGWPGLRVRDLVELAVLASRGGEVDGVGWPLADRVPVDGYRDVGAWHPHDPGVWLASQAGLSHLPGTVDAVVSLSRVGRAETAHPTVEFWLIDRDGANLNTVFTLADAADTIAALRAEGRTVAVHCVEARSRTVAVAAAYSMRLGMGAGDPIDRLDARTALAQIERVLPGSRVSSDFVRALETLAGHGRWS
ncbi:hypothetical protein GCM10027515_30560 [Schumannella luteola]|uniref:ADP-ribosylglycohydrolase n=1 Tax=Schumannella luteola TaxID=472059 RepID=A0A852Y9N1_9MICO|nr:ADP-ribosylglycohydrolase family protein [Schumannella luteola]NYG99143.1 ADP-ribosylglycohydrolase [Schumannella luteola]TPX02340.1 HD domain-containing protein [Schumannella luteola]